MRPLYLCLFLLFITSCSTDPTPIIYGQDACTFCQMTIVDKQHAAQLVTEKGKNYKYDAIECMINDLRKWKRPPVKTYLVADYANPGMLTDARSASYLITEKIPSPMGEFLTAFENKAAMKSLEVTGEEYSWTELKSKFELNDKLNAYEE